MYSIGLDIGTTSVCGIVIDIENEKIVKSLNRKNDTFIKTENSFEKIQDPKKLIGILNGILSDLLAEFSEISAIGITGQMHGIVYLNAEGEPISPLKIWQDGRGNLEFKDSLTYAQYITKETGYPVATGYGAVTYFYDKINGLVPSDTVSFCTIHDLAAMVLANRKEPLLHPSDAASFGLFDLKSNSFDTLAIKKLGLDPNLFPKVSSGFALAGNYKGIPVSVAIGDNQASFLGSVSNPKESILVNVGTGSQISGYANILTKIDGLDCRPLLDDSYILAGSSLCGGRAYAILEKLFKEVAETVCQTEVKSAYPAMDRLMENYDNSLPPLNVSTLFSGTRANPNLKGGIENIGVDNFTMAGLCDGFMVGMASELFDMYQEILPHLSKKPTLMIGSGNGIRMSPFLQKRFENIFGLKMQVPVHTEEAAFGASLYALVAAKVFPDIITAAKLIKYM